MPSCIGDVLNSCCCVHGLPCLRSSLFLLGMLSQWPLGVRPPRFLRSSTKLTCSCSSTLNAHSWCTPTQCSFGLVYMLNKGKFDECVRIKHVFHSVNTLNQLLLITYHWFTSNPQGLQVSSDVPIDGHLQRHRQLPFVALDTCTSILLLTIRTKVCHVSDLWFLISQSPFV